jgi:hypothetical protein
MYNLLEIKQGYVISRFEKGDVKGFALFLSNDDEPNCTCNAISTNLFFVTDDINEAIDAFNQLIDVLEEEGGYGNYLDEPVFVKTKIK